MYVSLWLKLLLECNDEYDGTNRFFFFYVIRNINKLKRSKHRLLFYVFARNEIVRRFLTSTERHFFVMARGITSASKQNS